MPQKSRKDWDPRKPKLPAKVTKGASSDELKRWLQGIVLLDIEGQIDLTWPGPAYVAIVHDGSGFNPGAIIAVDQNQYHDLSNEVLDTAFDALKHKVIEKSPDYVEELKGEWGDRWEEILTESFDGSVLVINRPEDVAFTIQSDPRGMELLEVSEE